MAQEPQLNPDKDVLGNVQEAVALARALLTEYERDQPTSSASRWTTDEMEKLLERQARVQDQIEHVNAWELDRQVEIAMDAMNLPPGDADVTKLSGGERRRVALCKLLLQQPDSAAAGRADEPSRRRERRLAERHLADYPAPSSR